MLRGVGSKTVYLWIDSNKSIRSIVELLLQWNDNALEIAFWLFLDVAGNLDKIKALKESKNSASGSSVVS